MFLCPFSLHPAKLQEKHSCYSGIPNTALCNDPDDTERIAIYDLQYARNCSKCHCYGSSSTCGQFTLPGSWENYYYYNAISGTQGSQFTTRRTPCPNSGPGGIYTNLVYLRFECVPEDKITDFCAMSMQTEGESVYLQYTPSENRHKIRDCHCFASSLSGGLQIHAVDIRFQHVQMDSTGACGINQKSYLQFDSENQTIKCIDKHIIGGYTNIYNTSNQNMDILLHLDGEPQSVWIRITATTGTKVNVSCENIPPTEVSTEAIISTKKTTFDVATSKPVKTSINPEKTKRPINTTDVERTTKVMRTPSIGLITTTETRLTSTQSTEHLSTISVNHHVSQQNLPEETTKGNIDYMPSEIIG
ncbi:Hypothetical predicted protein [Mytilus galloprovincialis]|uniref:Uncharacterized protein n=1 Tax=Mytilus galloprovincialis TaxID=29158 RepID=A0A8B6CPP1_MYTGA|nr:Hypothetical predicted protein [Mytilus galloprovincialis]